MTPIKIENAIGTDLYFTDEILDELTIIINKNTILQKLDLSGLEITINLSSAKDDDRKKTNIPENLSILLMYSSLDGIFKKQYIRKNNIRYMDLINSGKPLSDSILDILDDVIDHLERQIHCKHDFVRPLTDEGHEMPDGSAVCHLCGYEKNVHFEPIQGKILARNSFGKPFVAQCDWPEKTFLQCGGDGIVLGKDPYRTAFFEAFPIVSGIGCFIRGEGKSVTDAETQAWIKYEKYMNCASHEFTRVQKDKERTDGWGKCIHCGLSSTKALEPLTHCTVCHKPTSDKQYESSDYMCNYHVYEQNFDEHLKYVLEKEEKFAKKYNDTFDPKETIFNESCEFTIYQKLLEQKGEVWFSENKEHFSRFIYFLESTILHNVFGIRPFKENPNYPDFNDDKVQECLNYFLAKLDFFINIIDNDIKGSLSIKEFIPNHYIKTKED